jgi:tRNA nucleotidyltransferase (CCA-adding enzyme)
VERGSIKLDLHRRDFTINTLALRLDGRHYGELHDYWGGLEDLHAGLVRVLHSLSFIDDPTRILRATRFEQRFSFRIEDRTMQLLLEARPLIERLSGDRIRNELNHILSSEHATQIMARLDSLDLLNSIQPCLTWDSWLADHIASLKKIDPPVEWGLAGERLSVKRELAYTLWLIRLSVEQACKVSNRLKLSTNLSNGIVSACELWRDQDELECASPSALVARLEQVPPLSCYAFYLAVSDAELRDKLLSYITSWKTIQPITNGDMLKSLGLPPGPVYKQILGNLRNAWLDGRIATSEEENHLLLELLSNKGLSVDSHELDAHG